MAEPRRKRGRVFNSADEAMDDAERLMAAQERREREIASEGEALMDPNDFGAMAPGPFADLPPSITGTPQFDAVHGTSTTAPLPPLYPVPQSAPDAVAPPFGMNIPADEVSAEAALPPFSMNIPPDEIVLGGEAQSVATATPARSGGSGRRSAGMADQLAQMIRDGASPDRINALVAQLAESIRYEGALLEQTGVSNAADIYEAAQQQQAIHDQQVSKFNDDLLRQEEMLQDINAQIQQLRHERFDASRLFRDRGLGTSLALGVAVGAANSFMANALFPGTNTTNTSMQILNDAIDRDLREQMVQRQDRVTNIGMQRTALQQFRELSGDNQIAFDLAKAKSEMWAAQQLRARAMNTAGQASRQQMERQAIDLELQAAQREQAALDAMAQAMMQQRGGGGAGRPPKPPKAGEVDRGGQVWAPMMRLGPGVTFDDVRAALGESGAQDLRRLARSSSAMMRVFDNVRGILREAGSGERMLPLSQVRARLQSAFGQITGLMKEQLELGALDAGVERLVASIVPDPSGTLNLSAAQRIYEELRAESVAKVREVTEFGSSGLMVFDPTARVSSTETPSILEPGSEIQGDTLNADVTWMQRAEHYPVAVGRSIGGGIADVAGVPESLGESAGEVVGRSLGLNRELPDDAPRMARRARDLVIGPLGRLIQRSGSE